MKILTNIEWKSHHRRSKNPSADQVKIPSWAEWKVHSEPSENSIAGRVKIMSCILSGNLAYCGNACNTPSVAHLDKILPSTLFVSNILHNRTIVGIQCVLHVSNDNDTDWRFQSEIWKEKLHLVLQCYKVLQSVAKSTWCHSVALVVVECHWCTGTVVCKHQHSQKLSSEFELFGAPFSALFSAPSLFGSFPKIWVLFDPIYSLAPSWNFGSSKCEESCESSGISKWADWGPHLSVISKWALI